MSDQHRLIYCGQCGNPIQSGDRFCGECGAAILAPPPQAEQIIPEPVAAAQGAAVRSNRRALFVAGAVGALLVLLVGGGAIALLSSGGEERSNPSGGQPEKAVGAPEEPEDYGTTEPTTSSSPQPSYEEQEDALLEEFARSYDEAVRREDWEETYSMLDESSQQRFTEQEWAEKQQALRDINGLPAPLESVTVDQNEEVTDTPARVTLYYEDGTQETILAGVPMVVEDPSDSGVPKRFLTKEEISELEQLSTSGTDIPGPEDFEAQVAEAAGDYYRAAGREDWAYTYEHLDSETQGRFTREEWFKKNEWFANNGEVIYRIDSVRQVGTSSEYFAVTLTLTYEDGSSSTRTTYFVYEDGSWKHRFSQEEYDLFMPEASYEEFVEAKGGNPSGGAGEQQTVPPSEELFPEDNKPGGEEI